MSQSSAQSSRIHWHCRFRRVVPNHSGRTKLLLPWTIPFHSAIAMSSTAFLLSLGSVSWGSGLVVPDTLLLALAANQAAGRPHRHSGLVGTGHGGTSGCQAAGRPALCDYSQMAMWSWSLRTASYGPTAPGTSPQLVPNRFWQPAVRHAVSRLSVPTDTKPLRGLRSFIGSIKERRKRRREVKARAMAKQEELDKEMRRAKVVSWYDAGQRLTPSDLD